MFASRNRTYVLVAAFVVLALTSGAFHVQNLRGALVVNTNMQSINALNKLNATAKRLNQVFERISSGLRINSAADDAAGLSMSESMDAEAATLRQAIRNTDEALVLVKVVEGSAEDVSNILKRMRELAVQSSSETLGADEREYIDDEFDELYNTGDELSLVIDDLELSGIATDTAGSGTAQSVAILWDEYEETLVAVASVIDDELFALEDAAGAASLAKQAEKGLNAVMSAKKDVLRAVEFIAKDGEKVAKVVERAAQIRDLRMYGAAGPAKAKKSSSRGTKSSSKTSRRTSR